MVLTYFFLKNQTHKFLRWHLMPLRCDNIPLVPLVVQNLIECDDPDFYTRIKS